MFKPSRWNIPVLDVHVISVANPNPDVGITRGNIVMSSIMSFPLKFFLAKIYANGNHRITSIITVIKASLKER